jgi:hypothetical protein
VKITIGADPELFLYNQKGLPQPAYQGTKPLIPGTKYEPHKLADGAIQIDGCAIEFNVNPTDNVEEFMGSIDRIIKNLRGRLNAYILSIEPTIQFDKEAFDSLPAEAKELGCDPDFNAYTRTLNATPRIPLGFRTAAGHIHVGWTKDESIYEPRHLIQGFDLARQLDLALYIPSLLWDGSNSARQKYYGKPGAMRPKPYGMEYRVLSNLWLTHPALIRYVFEMTMWASQEFFKDNLLFDPHNDTRAFTPPTDTVTWVKSMEDRGAPRYPMLDMR